VGGVRAERFGEDEMCAQTQTAKRVTLTETWRKSSRPATLLEGTQAGWFS
jgi:hypothetical protein